MKATLKEVKQIQQATPAELKNKYVKEFKYEEIAYVSKPASNWGYTLYVIIYNGELYKVAAAFGYII